MIPVYSDEIQKDFSRASKPSKTYRLNKNETVRGEVDELEAVKQAIYLILNTERYKHEIYSWNYGVELSDIIEKPAPLCYSLIKQRIGEALIVDDRITSVDNFKFTKNKGSVTVTFNVGTIYGDLEYRKEVEV